MTRLSFEFFPPQTDKGRASLVRTAEQLKSYDPLFFSVTYGAGGSTRDRTLDAIEALRRADIDAAPHLSWGSDNSSDLCNLIEHYLELGVSRIVTLRGDLPSGMGTRKNVRHAAELVRFIRDKYADRLQLEVAAYPETHPDAPSPDADIGYLKEKIDAGADSCITQYFYSPDSYFFFVDRCRQNGIDAPIVPGIMPITNYDGLVRFSDGCGAEIPRWIRLRLESLRDDEPALQAFGADVVSGLCERLLDGGAPGLHFYTLNKAGPTQAVIKNLDLESPVGSA